MESLNIETKNTVMISSELLGELRQVASGRGISISVLCAKILKEGIKRESSIGGVGKPTTIILKDGMGECTSVSVQDGIDIWNCTEQTSRRRLESLVANGLMTRWKDARVPNRYRFSWVKEIKEVELTEEGIPSLETMLAAPVDGEEYLNGEQEADDLGIPGAHEVKFD